GSHCGGAALDGLYDILIARAPAQIAVELRANRLFGRARMAAHEIERAHDHARRAEAALHAVAFLKCRLHGMQRAVSARETLDREDLRADRLRRENGARLHGFAVQMHRARAALAGITSDVRACEAESVAEEIDEERSRIVEVDRDG